MPDDPRDGREPGAAARPDRRPARGSRRSGRRRGSRARPAARPRRAPACVAASPNLAQLQRNRSRELIHRLARVGDDDEPVGGRRDDLLAQVRAAAALDQPAVRRDLVGRRRSRCRGDPRSRTTRRRCRAPAPFRSVAGEVATQRIESWRAASAGSRKATVEPVPSPTFIPSSTSSAAASAATRFSVSVGDSSGTDVESKRCPVMSGFECLPNCVVLFGSQSLWLSTVD